MWWFYNSCFQSQYLKFLCFCFCCSCWFSCKVPFSLDCVFIFWLRAAPSWNVVWGLFRDPGCSAREPGHVLWGRLQGWSRPLSTRDWEFLTSSCYKPFEGPSRWQRSSPRFHWDSFPGRWAERASQGTAPWLGRGLDCPPGMLRALTSVLRLHRSARPKHSFRWLSKCPRGKGGSRTHCPLWVPPFAEF